MITEFNFPDREWQLYVSNVNLEYYLKFIKKFECITQPVEKKSAFWHDTISEYVLEYFKNKPPKGEIVVIIGGKKEKN